MQYRGMMREGLLKSSTHVEVTMLIRIAIIFLPLLSMYLVGCRDIAKEQDRVEETTEPKIINSIGMTMIRVEPGSFLMGRESSIEIERPREAAVTQAFYTSSLETSREQFAAFCRASQINPSVEIHYQIKDGTSGDLPITSVTWSEAKAFCEWLSRTEGRQYDLPTQVEWEYACCGGNAHKSASSQPALQDHAWYVANSNDGLHPRGQLEPNELGLYDMLGNCWEWCKDRVPKDVVASTPYAGQPCAFIRGGAFFNHPKSCNCAAGYGFEPIDSRNRGIGFRVVCR